MYPDLNSIEDITTILNSIPLDHELANKYLSKSVILLQLTLLTKFKILLISLMYLSLVYYIISPIITKIFRINNGFIYYNVNILLILLFYMNISSFYRYDEFLNLTNELEIPNLKSFEEIRVKELIESIHGNGLNLDHLCFNRINNGVLDGYFIEISIGGYKIENNELNDFQFCLKFESIEFLIKQKYIAKIAI